ncbi:MAG: glutathione S-transferase N-terminal domain-containing protein [Litorivicinaceae bacterium]|jgi:stringent starvation protein A|nr:glutathione S-transferase N-terminal domain-containing protein [Litorivicinaceae bacterium]MDP5328537.1 glutathione S-transferase N-terminal domain-containing protein [Litorivicinaceae bacterium]MDP5330484.1 glutathione S-transferase N-terminal domain-containing protein [Litorivicinaceae bacterium]MDP5341003.1 glutathione S-transferase N-terminal domain-containing protein [Litorivicinaceae bacterium]MDP5342036.1 glutathione S-transferase N-terminal domain-containing protein [Litorivicinaceae
MSVVTKRSTMTFFSDPTDYLSHRVRIVLAEKGVTVDIIDCDPDAIPEEVSEINPYNSLPTLLDRDLVLYEPNIMMEYLDERFPHPPLLPVYPVARGNARMFLHRIEKEWSPLIRVIEQTKRNNKRPTAAIKELRDQLITISPIFDEMPYFMSEEFSIVDCTVAPILWRLPHMGIELPPKQTRGLQDYQYRMFNRDAFQASLSEAEREMPRV